MRNPFKPRYQPPMTSGYGVWIWGIATVMGWGMVIAVSSQEHLPWMPWYAGFVAGGLSFQFFQRLRAWKRNQSSEI